MNTITKQNILTGQRVLIRSSLNVSLGENAEIIDDLRLRRTVETIELVLGAGGIPILLSHIKNEQGSTMKPVVEWFVSRGYQAQLVSDYFPYNDDLDNFASGQLYIFENLRDYDGEKANDPLFARQLAKYGDIFINESFDAAHRSHASIVGIPSLLPAYAGLNFAEEVAELSKVFEPTRPFTFIIGGAKIETKAPLIAKLLDHADHVYVGGALMNPLLAYKGINIGQSVMPDQPIDVSVIANHPNLVLPTDFIDQDHQVVTLDSVASDSQLLDIGPHSTEVIKKMIANSAQVVWNGPLGNYEAGYSSSSDEVAGTLSSCDCYSIVGGGDTLAAINDQMEGGINWISTGGGAMLDFVESNGDLPAIWALG